MADIYGDLRLEAVLRSLLRHTGAAAGSVSLIDAGAGLYTKAAEYGAFCRLGDTFPLDEGATGRAYARRRPVVIPEYGQLRSGHLVSADRVRRGSAAAVPIWWRGEVIAVCVVFAPSFTTRDVDDLETLTQAAAAAIVRTARFGRPSPAPPVTARFAELPPVKPPPLTAREAGVLELMRQGLTYREIASRLGLSPKTVEKHVGAVIRKTGTRNRTAAVVTALESGWVGDSPHTASG
ncbi:GAF domain-containing protein [Paractinoplanes atraurantiacus]|uniref:GAF domain-containing protein n=1 Tax=Paractinoplanes atraurantiacus TaxID=1036182 RepID=A0A285HR08_9ACTN|nr:GAF domain-containing protein [Actinoplanes atraurantiacus]